LIDDEPSGCWGDTQPSSQTIPEAKQEAAPSEQSQMAKKKSNSDLLVENSKSKARAEGPPLFSDKKRGLDEVIGGVKPMAD